MDIIIKQAEAIDSAQLLQYTEKLLSEKGHNAPFAPGEFSRTQAEQEEIIVNLISEQNSVYLLAFNDESIVGEISCRGFERIPLQHVTVLSMSVDSQYRGQGIGSQLMQAALQWCTESPLIKRIELYTFANNTTAHALYKKFGFEVEGKRKDFVKIDGEYIDDIIMAKFV